MTLWILRSLPLLLGLIEHPKMKRNWKPTKRRGAIISAGHGDGAMAMGWSWCFGDIVLSGLVEAKTTVRSRRSAPSSLGTYPYLNRFPFLSPSGMAAFSAAHLFYLWAFGLSPLKPGLLLFTTLASLIYYSFLLPHLELNMVLPVLSYGLILNSMLWRSLVWGGSAGWGAVLFTISDGVLAWNTFVHSLPFAHIVIMSTYYAAQLLFTLSALRYPGLKTH